MVLFIGLLFLRGAECPFLLRDRVNTSERYRTSAASRKVDASDIEHLPSAPPYLAQIGFPSSSRSQPSARHINRPGQHADLIIEACGLFLDAESGSDIR